MLPYLCFLLFMGFIGLGEKQKSVSFLKLDSHWYQDVVDNALSWFFPSSLSL